MIIPQEVYDLYYETVDDMTDYNFGVTCTLNYPEVREDCPNCIFDSLTNKSSNQYQSGGPISFTDGLCPYCNGVGYKSVVSTEDIKLRVYFDKKSFGKTTVPINIPDGGAMAIGKIGDLPKVLRCNTIVFNTPISGYNQYLFTLQGEPVLHGILKSRYFISIWKRA